MHAHTKLLFLDSTIAIDSEAQAQGDILIYPVARPDGMKWTALPAQGRELLRREGSAHAHFVVPFDSNHRIRFATQYFMRETVLGYLDVPKHEHAYLLHTHEHLPLGIGPGVYEICRKREHAFSLEQLRWNRQATRLVND